VVLWVMEEVWVTGDPKEDSGDLPVLVGVVVGTEDPVNACATGASSLGTKHPRAPVLQVELRVRPRVIDVA
jgi:hypothetical protein